MKTIAFCDLTHTGRVISANYFPLGVAYIASTTKKHFKNYFDVDLFKYPESFSEYLENKTPDIVCFSNYMWNANLQLAYAKALKTNHPGVITVFGGPNYPTEKDSQLEFLANNQQIDFYIDGEAELAFVELTKTIDKYNFNYNELKKDQVKIPNTQYLSNGAFISGDVMPRIMDIEEIIPSPYLSGLMDSFFDDTLMPLVQTSRGCPYACTFCHDGIKYMNKTRRFAQERIEDELTYISERVKTRNLFLADLNWGMFADDILTAKHIASIFEKTGWPRDVVSATAKNQKKHVVEISEILGDSFQVGASVQSTDEVVLKDIKRKNIGVDAITKMATESAKRDSTSFTEIILGLPSDSLKKHKKSIKDMVDTGIQEIKTYQFILLPGTEAASNISQSKYEYEIRFRVLPKSFGRYSLNGQIFNVVEYNQVVVGNKTLTHEEYIACRDFHLTMAIFNNGNILDEITALASIAGISRYELLDSVHQVVTKEDHVLYEIYERYRTDEKLNFWNEESDLIKFCQTDEGLDKYLSGEYGANQIYKFHMEVVFLYFDDVVDVMINSLTEAIKLKSFYDEIVHDYIDELRMVIRAKKSHLTNLDLEFEFMTHFDFIELESKRYLLDPRQCRFESPKIQKIGYETKQKEMLRNYFEQYGDNLEGIGNLIHRHPMKFLYRQLMGNKFPNENDSVARASIFEYDAD